MDELRAAIRARLDEVATARPDLVPAIALQRGLLDREVELLGVFAAGGLPSLSLPPRYIAAKLGRGIPVLYGEPIPLPLNMLTLTARDFCDRLATGGAGESAQAVAHALEMHTIDPAALLSAVFGRDQQRVRMMAAQRDLVPDLVWLVAELALAPFVHLLQVRIMDSSADANPVTGARKTWDRGFCPVCGSWPAVIEAIGGAHVLRCSFCAAGWQLSSYRCLYCDHDGELFITAAPNPEQPGRRVQACGKCGAYVKVLELVAPTRFPMVAIEDLASMDLDMAAIERKYVRPPLPEIRRS
jgi:FdhE protein